MIVTISGPIGSGKTTVAEAVARTFNLTHLSAGRIFRQMAEEKGMSLQEFSALAEQDHSFDKEVDARQKEEASRGNCVVDGGLSGHLIEADLKIWLTAPLAERARRVAGRENIDFETALAQTRAREASELKRYREIYGIDGRDTSPYDVVINTVHWDKESVIEIITKMIASSKVGRNLKVTEEGRLGVR